MNSVFRTRLRIDARARIHLPWQGCWRVTARELREPVEVMGMHLPLICSEHRHRVNLVSFDCPPPDAIQTLQLQFEHGQLHVTARGDWKRRPRHSVHHFENKKSAIEWIRSRFPVLQPHRQRRWKRMFILDIHDPRGNLLQTFADVKSFVSQCATLGLAHGTLFYLPGWDGTYDDTYPDYVPAQSAGGETGFKQLVEHARSKGGEVFPHMNFWGLSHSRVGKYPHLMRCVLRDSNGQKAGWPGAMWCGATNPLYYVNPSAPAWLSLFSQRLKRLERLGVRAIYLDQVAPPLQENWRAQMIAFANHINRRHPSLVFGSEALNLDVLPFFPLAQLLGPVWSAMPELPTLKPSPFLAQVVRGAAQLVGHLSTPAPYPTLYAWTNYVYVAQLGIERAFRNVQECNRRAGTLPTMRLNSRRTEQNARILRQLA